MSLVTSIEDGEGVETETGTGETATGMGVGVGVAVDGVLNRRARLQIYPWRVRVRCRPEASSVL